MKKGSRIVLYRDSKFDANNFRQVLKDCLHEVNREDVGSSEFNERVETLLNEHAAIKKNVRANDGSFMTEVLRKAIYTRTNLCNRYNKIKSQAAVGILSTQGSIKWPYAIITLFTAYANSIN